MTVCTLKKDGVDFKAFGSFARRIKACTRCELGCDKFCDVPYYRKKPKALFIAEAPNLERDVAGATLTGKCKPMFEKALEILGITRDDVWITNAIKCTSRHVKEGNAELCKPYLIEELYMVDCPIVIPMGRVAVASLLDAQTPLNADPIRSENFTFYPVMHPCSLLYRPDLEDAYYKSFSKIRPQLYSTSLPNFTPLWENKKSPFKLPVHLEEPYHPD
jgi:uracil-DNA glycosylase family 4